MPRLFWRYSDFGLKVFSILGHVRLKRILNIMHLTAMSIFAKVAHIEMYFGPKDWSCHWRNIQLAATGWLSIIHWDYVEINVWNLVTNKAGQLWHRRKCTSQKIALRYVWFEFSPKQKKCSSGNELGCHPTTDCIWTKNINCRVLVWKQ
jgi:hypothetical protein